MSKVFRLYTGGTDTFRDWNNGVQFPYDSTARDTIQDPEGASAKNEITSIPSPFARIDLVKMAFKEVVRMRSLDGDTIFHKMVSDSLDVGEIFFNFKKFSDKIEIITWDYAAEIVNLANSTNVGHRYYGDALEKYKVSDGPTYNFDKLKNIYLLNYKNGPKPLNIIGATSPSTLFFSTANNLSYIKDIYFAHDIPFDDEYMPLYKRADKEYIKSWFLLKNTIPNFATLFPEVDAYLELTYQEISDNDFKDILRTINGTAPGFGSISISSQNQMNDVEVLGHTLYQKTHTISTSGFEIASSIFKGTSKPYILPVEAGNKYADIPYTTGKWGKTNCATYYDKEPDINKRILPFDGTPHPYLTISDFLEDYIIKVPHTLNKDFYFNGNCILESEYRLSYLLPLKKEFFNYFTSKELIEGFDDGKEMMKMESLAGDSIKVIIRIPIKGDSNVHFVEYSRIYYGGNNKPDRDNNRGGIIEFDFDGFIMPNIRFNNPQEAIYTIGFVGFKQYSFNFFSEQGQLQNIPIDERNTSDSSVEKANTYTIEGQNFDFIQVTSKTGIAGVIVPIFKPQTTNCDFSFAIDLGTSNTHIEYIQSPNNKPQEFSIEENEEFLCRMFVPSFNKELQYQEDLSVAEEQISKNYLPFIVGGQSDFRFPTRTVLSYSKDNINWQNAIRPFGLINIPLTYNRRLNLIYNQTEDDIKWGKNKMRQIEAYIGCLMLMIRNKVILNGGRLNNTKITWFYPISMAPRRKNILNDTWNAAYKKYFGNGTTSNMTESEAPIQYYFRRHAEATRLVNIDIGGGTTDIAFAKDKEIQFVTSFKFAANALFEDSLSQDVPNNGIIDYYKPIFREILNGGQGLQDLPNIFNTNEDKPANMAMFLFSLSSNTLANKLNKNEIDFNAKLREDDNFKIIFIMFYAAIIYHIAQIVKIQKLDVPRHITFSGNGSKVLSILTTNSKDLAELTKKIFEHVLGRPYDSALEILGIDDSLNPKKSTCKGGLMGVAQDVDKKKVVIMKSDASGFVTDNDTYDSINATYKKNVAKSVNDFFDYVLSELNTSFNFNDYFGVTQDAINTAKEVCKNDIETYVDRGLALMKEEADGQNNKLDETLFFYPIKGVLQKLSIEINKTL